MRDATRMSWYYLGVPFAKLTRRSWPHPRFNTKYNALQRPAYFFDWMTWIFGGYDKARIWHFWLMWSFVLFVVPHLATQHIS